MARRCVDVTRGRYSPYDGLVQYKALFLTNLPATDMGRPSRRVTLSPMGSSSSAMFIIQKSSDLNEYGKHAFVILGY